MHRVEGRIRTYDHELETWLFSWTCPACKTTNESELDHKARCKDCQTVVLVTTSHKNWTQEYK